jgi:hypothetical protein
MACGLSVTKSRSETRLQGFMIQNLDRAAASADQSVTGKVFEQAAEVDGFVKTRDRP